VKTLLLQPCEWCDRVTEVYAYHHVGGGGAGGE
jgi:hypothetical protein